ESSLIPVRIVSGVATVGVLLEFFFFQAEDGIRDYKVTGVQTCALQISKSPPSAKGWRSWCRFCGAPPEPAPASPAFGGGWGFRRSGRPGPWARPHPTGCEPAGRR